MFFGSPTSAPIAVSFTSNPTSVGMSHSFDLGYNNNNNNGDMPPLSSLEIMQKGLTYETRNVRQEIRNDFRSDPLRRQEAATGNAIFMHLSKPIPKRGQATMMKTPVTTNRSGNNNNRSPPRTAPTLAMKPTSALRRPHRLMKGSGEAPMPLPPPRAPSPMLPISSRGGSKRGVTLEVATTPPSTGGGDPRSSGLTPEPGSQQQVHYQYSTHNIPIIESDDLAGLLGAYGDMPVSAERASTAPTSMNISRKAPPPSSGGGGGTSLFIPHIPMSRILATQLEIQKTARKTVLEIKASCVRYELSVLRNVHRALLPFIRVGYLSPRRRRQPSPSEGNPDLMMTFGQHEDDDDYVDARELATMDYTAFERAFRGLDVTDNNILRALFLKFCVGDGIELMPPSSEATLEEQLQFLIHARNQSNNNTVNINATMNNLAHTTISMSNTQTTSRVKQSMKHPPPPPAVVVAAPLDDDEVAATLDEFLLPYTVFMDAMLKMIGDRTCVSSASNPLQGDDDDEDAEEHAEAIRENDTAAEASSRYCFDLFDIHSLGHIRKQDIRFWCQRQTIPNAHRGVTAVMVRSVAQLIHEAEISDMTRYYETNSKKKKRKKKSKKPFVLPPPNEFLPKNYRRSDVIGPKFFCHHFMYNPKFMADMFPLMVQKLVEEK
eukprot:PhM_4_TR13061/c0_g1_i1/m.44151